MLKIKFSFSTIFIILLSIIWPLGQNPLPGDPFIIINKQTNELAFIKENRIQMVVPSSTGKEENLTPEGIFTITVKAINPYYRRQNIAGGEPNNPLGSRWLGFDAKETDGRTYGVHGTNRPEQIGANVTSGCVRLHNEHVERLYDLVPIGTKVFITNSEESFYQLGKKFNALQ